MKVYVHYNSDGQLIYRNGTSYYITPAYLLGAYDAAESKPRHNPFPPGPQYGQYNWGYDGEKNGSHDNVELPYEDRHK